MEIDLSKLLSLPAAQRLELAELLRKSVGYPGDIETLPLPAWRQAGLERLLDRYAGDETEA
jgi:hypothetical protein